MPFDGTLSSLLLCVDISSQCVQAHPSLRMGEKCLFFVYLTITSGNSKRDVACNQFSFLLRGR